MKNKTATAVANKETKFDVTVVPIDSIKPNEDNPRSIKDKNLKKLVNSIIEFPQMLSLRPIIVDDNDVILAGNMRHKAAKIAGLTDVPVIKASSLTQEQTRQFIVKDNASFGDWELEKLLSQYTLEELDAYAVELPELELNELAEENDNINLPSSRFNEGDLIQVEVANNVLLELSVKSKRKPVKDIDEPVQADAQVCQEIVDSIRHKHAKAVVKVNGIEQR